MRLEIVPKHSARLGGVPVEVDNAQIFRCSECGEISVQAEEMRRWEDLQQSALREASLLPSPAEVKAIRESLSLSVSDFAAMLGVTRQTLHAWERPEGKGLPLGPAALLLKLLQKELDGHGGKVLDGLVRLAEKRGQRLPIASPDENDSSPASAGTRTRAIRERPRGGPAFCMPDIQVNWPSRPSMATV